MAINFAVIGCGMLARSTHIPNITRNPRTTLHTCCDLDEDALAICRDQHGAQHTSTDWQAVVREPDIHAICLATTEKLRLPVIALAAELGKPIYVEKPIARELDEVLAIHKVVKDSGIPFCLGHNRRSSPAMLEAHRIFRAHMENPQPCPWRYDREGDARPRIADDGLAGMSVRINDDWHSWKNWVFDKEQAPHGPMLFEMTHFTDVCNWFLAAEPEEVIALEHGVFNHGVVIKYKTGEMATISMAANGTFGYPKELYECFGNGGALAIDHMVEIRTAGIEGAPPRIPFPLAGETQADVGEGHNDGLYGWLEKKRAACKDAVEANDPNLSILNPDADKGHAYQLDRFLDEIEGKGPVVCGIDDALNATRIAFAAVKAAHEKRAVQIEELG